MSPEEEKERQRERARAYYAANRELVSERAKSKRKDPVAGEALRQRTRELKAAWPDEVRERQAQRTRDWYRQNPRSPEKNAEMHYRARYRITVEQREQMAADQEGLCYLCGGPLPSETRKVHTDHDRSCCKGSTSCGQCIRGLSCEHCNRGIGMFNDDPDRMRRAADALEAAKARVQARSQSA
jgi:hypothetical protein